MDENKVAAVSYKIETGLSRFTVKAFATGLLAMMGHSPTIAIRNFAGEAHVAPDNPSASSLQMTIKTDSFDVTGEFSDKDRKELLQKMREEVLEVARFPDIVFKSSQVLLTRIAVDQYRVKITGDLSLHGVTRSRVIEAQVAILGDSLRAYGEFTLLQSDFQIKPVSALGGTIKLKDELKLKFDIVAKPSQSS